MKKLTTLLFAAALTGTQAYGIIQDQHNTTAGIPVNPSGSIKEIGIVHLEAEKAGKAKAPGYDWKKYSWEEQVKEKGKYIPQKSTGTVKTQAIGTVGGYGPNEIHAGKSTTGLLGTEGTGVKAGKLKTYKLGTEYTDAGTHTKAGKTTSKYYVGPASLQKMHKTGDVKTQGIWDKLLGKKKKTKTIKLHQEAPASEAESITITGEETVRAQALGFNPQKKAQKELQKSIDAYKKQTQKALNDLQAEKDKAFATLSQTEKDKASKLHTELKELSQKASEARGKKPMVAAFVLGADAGKKLEEKGEQFKKLVTKQNNISATKKKQLHNLTDNVIFSVKKIAELKKTGTESALKLKDETTALTLEKKRNFSSDGSSN